MRDAQPQTVYLKDYRPSGFLIEKTWLNFDLREDFTRVECRLQIRRNPQVADTSTLELQGQELELLELSLDGVALSGDDYLLSGDSLCIPDCPERFELYCVTRINPQDNTSLEGLYKSRTMYCTQCEAQGFENYLITWIDQMSCQSSPCG